MSFCAQCEIYLAPDATLCPNCGTDQPQAEPITALRPAELNESPTGPPLVAGDLLLLPTQEPGSPSQHGTLHALNLADGEPRWQRSFEHALISGLTAAQILKVSETLGVLVATTSTDLLRGEGALLALDATGRERWRWAPGVQRVSSPTVAEDVVCVTADARTFVVLDLATGDERTSVSLDASASLAAPALENDVAYVPCRGPHLLAASLDGRLCWWFDAQTSPKVWLDQTPVLIGEHLVAVLSNGSVLALNIQDGSLVWQTNVGPPGKRPSPPSADGRRLYLGARDGLHALDLTDGREFWQFPTPRRIVAAPVVAGNTVYATCHDQYLYALDAATGRELWRYGAKRRIEVSPTITATRAFIADRGGMVTAIARPLSAVENEVAGHWVEAASAYAALGQFAQGAELLEVHDEPFKAAELWKAAGEWERAAVQYEKVKAWQQAATLWGGLGQTRKQSEALAAYQHKLARDRQQPIIALDVEHKGLVLETWSHLTLVIRNAGYGPAHKLIIRASGDQFQGQVMATQRITTLLPGGERTDKLDIRPLQHGDSVPLHLTVEYNDQRGDTHTFEQTIHIPVARTETTRGADQVLHINTGGGAVVLGDVSTTGGDFVGRDKLTSGEQDPTDASGG